jgi:hypothetical protein
VTGPGGQFLGRAHLLHLLGQFLLVLGQPTLLLLEFGQCVGALADADVQQQENQQTQSEQPDGEQGEACGRTTGLVSGRAGTRTAAALLVWLMTPPGSCS